MVFVLHIALLETSEMRKYFWFALAALLVVALQPSVSDAGSSGAGTGKKGCKNASKEACSKKSKCRWNTKVGRCTGKGKKSCKNASKEACYKKSKCRWSIKARRCKRR
jgi:hypothetical protein